MILSPSYVLTFSSGVIKNQVQYQMVSQLKINGFKQKSNIYLIYLEIFVVNFCKTLIKNWKVFFEKLLNSYTSLQRVQ